MTTLYLVRHGETVDNVAKIMQGQRQGALTPEGMAQMQRLAPTLADIGADALLSSDLQRSIHSATILGEHLHLSVHQTPLLRERDWGDFTGRYIPDLQQLPFPDNVETMEALLARAAAFLRFVRDSYPDQVVIAVGHGIINKAIQSVFYGKPMNEITKMTNAECRVLSPL